MRPGDQETETHGPHSAPADRCNEGGGDLDLRDDKFGREETAGVRSAIDGICTVARDDEQRIAAAGPMLDGLYSHFSLRTRRKPARANAAKSARS